MRKHLLLILLLSLFLQVSCKKDDTPDTSGIATIDNTRTLGQTYYVYGFLFAEAKKVSTLDSPPPDITVDSDGTNLLLMADNFKDSFYLAGEYNNASAAQNAFNSLTSATISETDWVGMASPIKREPDMDLQVWNRTFCKNKDNHVNRRNTFR